MKIIGFNASPRKNGNTARTIAQILESAAEAGAETQAFHAGDLNIGPCRGARCASLRTRVYLQTHRRKSGVKIKRL